MSLLGAPKVLSGSLLRASQWNALRSQIVRNSVVSGRRGEGDAIMARAFFIGRVVDVSVPGALGAVPPAQYPATSPVLYAVALDETFSEASRGGVTYTYTDANTRQADATEDQEVTPKYIVGDSIVIGTVAGVLVDMNIAGRQWAKV